MSRTQIPAGPFNMAPGATVKQASGRTDISWNKPFVCPDCGSETDPNLVRCDQCGRELRERTLTEELLEDALSSVRELYEHIGTAGPRSHRVKLAMIMLLDVERSLNL